MAKGELHARCIEPAQPGTQQRRSFERFRKHAAACPHKCRLAERLAPIAQGIGRECVDGGFQFRRRLAIAREKLRQRLAMGEIESTAACHQEFAAGRRHCVVDGDASGALREHLGRHQPGGPCADDGDVD